MKNPPRDKPPGGLTAQAGGREGLWSEPVCEARSYSQAIQARERCLNLQAKVEELQKLIDQYEAIPVEDMEEEIATLRGSRDEWEAACKHYVARIAELEGALKKVQAKLRSAMPVDEQTRGNLRTGEYDWLIEIFDLVSAALAQGDK